MKVPMLYSGDPLTGEQLIDMGILQEINRQFLHPLGISLCVSKTEADDGYLRCRFETCGKDIDGFRYDDTHWKGHEAEAVAKAELVKQRRSQFSAARCEILGAQVQPLPEVPSDD